VSKEIANLAIMKTESSTQPVADRRTELAAAVPRLSNELERLIVAFEERSVRLREVLEVTQGRGYTMLLILLAIPFCTPIPLPGFSAPFGLMIALIGFRLALVQKPWLPERLLARELPPKFFSRVLRAARKLAAWLEKILKPRLRRVLEWVVVRHLMGVMILVCGLLMVLPLPVPFSNGLPAFTVLLLAAAMLEEDGYMAIAGALMFTLTAIFFGAIFWGGAEAVNFMKEWFGGLLVTDDPGPPSILPAD